MKRALSAFVIAAMLTVGIPAPTPVFAATPGSTHANITPVAQVLTATVNGTTLFLVYDSDLSASPLPATGDYAVEVNGNVIPVVDVAVSDTSVILKLGTGAAAGDTVSLAYAPGPNGLQTVDGAPVPTLSDLDVTNVSRTPAAPVATVNGTTLTLTYDVEMDPASTPAPDAYRVRVGGADAAVSAVVSSGPLVTLTLAQGATADDQVTLDYVQAQPLLMTTNGTPAPALAGSSVTNASERFAMNTATISGTTLALTFDSPIDAKSQPAPGDFAVQIGSANPKVLAAKIEGNAVRLTIATGASPADQVKVQYTPGTKPIANLAGTPAGGFGWTVVASDLSLSLVSAVVNGDSLALTYDSLLNAAVPADPASYEVSINSGNWAAATKAVISGSTVSLTLPKGATASDSVVVSYTQGSSPVQDSNGVLVPAFSGQPAVNSSVDPHLQAATVNGRSVVLVFDTWLRSTPAPRIGLKVHESGDPAPARSVTPASVAVETNTLSLVLPTGVKAANVDVTVEFTQADGLASSSGTPVVVPATAVTNIGSAVKVKEKSINGRTLTVIYDGALDESQAVDKSGFAVTVPGLGDVPVNDATVSGNVLRLTLNQGAMKTDSSVTLAIDASKVSLAGATGVPVDLPADPAVENRSKDSDLNSASLYGVYLDLLFNSPLSPNSVPAGGDFAVTVDATSQVAVSRVAITGATMTLTLAAPVPAGAQVSVNYTPGTNSVMTMSGSPYARSTVPVINVANRSTDFSVTGASVNGSTLTMELAMAPVTTALPDPDDFVVTKDSGLAQPTALRVAKVAISQRRIILSLSQGVRSSDSGLRVTYNPGRRTLTAANGVQLGQSTTAVANRSQAFGVSKAVVVGNLLTLIYTTPPNPQIVPLPSDFAVTIAKRGTTVKNATVKKVELLGSAVVLTLDPGAQKDDTVTVTYLPWGRRMANEAGSPAEDYAPDPPSPPTNRSALFSLTTASIYGRTLTLTYNAPPDPASLPSASDYTVRFGGTTVPVTKVAIKGSAVLLALQKGPSEGQTVTVDYSRKPSSKPLINTTGSPADQFVDRDAGAPSSPEFVSATVTGNRLELAYDSAFATASLPAPTDFQVSVTGNPGAAVSKVSLIGNRAILTLNKGARGDDTVTVGYKPGTRPLYDLDGRPVNKLDPTPAANQSVSLEAVSQAVNGNQLVIKYDTTLSARCVPAPGDFSVHTSKGDLTVSKVAVAGNAVTLQLLTGVSPAHSPVTLDYTPGSTPLCDATGTVAGAMPGAAVANESADLNFTAAVIDGNVLSINYDAPLSTKSVPAPTDYKVSYGQKQVSVTAVGIAGNRIDLTLIKGFDASATVLVDYNPGSKPVMDVTGSPAGALLQQPVTNNSESLSLVAETIFGTRLVLTYDGQLNEKSVPAATDFTVKYDEQPVAVSSVKIAGKAVMLQMVRGAVAGQSISIFYPVGVKPIMNVAGTPAPALTGAAVTNSSPVIGTPVAVVTGDALTVTYPMALKSSPVPEATDYSVRVGGTSRSVSKLTLAGSSVTLTLSSGVTDSDLVTVDYTPGTKPVLITAGIPVPALAGAAVINKTTAYQSPAASVNGTILTLVYNVKVMSTSVPAASDYAVTVGGATIAVNKVTVRDNAVILGLVKGVAAGQPVILTYARSSKPLLSREGSPAPAFSGLAVTNTSASLGTPTATVNGSSLVATFPSSLKTSPVPPVTAFAVKFGSDVVPVTKVAISGAALTLTLAKGATNGSPAVTVSYRVAGSAPLQNAQGVPAAEFSVTATNNSHAVDLTSVSVTGVTLILSYTSPLNSGSTPQPADYGVVVDDAPAKVTKVAIAGSSVKLTLAQVVRPDAKAVKLDYTAAAKPVMSTSGSPADNLSDQTVTVKSTQIEPISSMINGNSLSLTFSSALDSTSVPDAKDFTVAVGSSRPEVTKVRITGATVKLTLTTGAKHDDAVTLDYAPKSKALVNKVGGVVGALTSQPAVNVTAGVELVQATVKGWTVTLVYSNTLNSSAKPDKGDFAVHLDSEADLGAVNVTNVAVSGTQVILTLNRGASPTDSVTLDYTPGAKPLMDLAASPADRLDGQYVNNLSTAVALVSSRVSGTTVTLTFNQSLHSGSVPAPGDFTVWLGGAKVDVKTVTISGKTVTLRLTSGANAGEPFTGGYTPGAKPLLTSTGVPVAPF